MTVTSGERRLLQRLAQHSRELMAVIASDGSVTYASAALRAQLPPGLDLDGHPARALLHPGSLDEALATFERCIETGQPQRVDVRLLLAGPSPELAFEAGRWFEVTLHSLVDDPAVEGVVATAHDITDRVASAKELEHLAYHDRLTGLPNRLALERRLEQAEAAGELIAVMVIDLDRFKHINDRFGEDAGDAVLRSMAYRVRREVRAAGLCAYLGGDEFALCLSVEEDPASMEVFAERMIGVLSEPVRVGEVVLVLGASAGLAVPHPHPLHGDELLRRADSAMHQAKREGRGRVVLFDAEGAERAAARVAVAERLVQAEELDELLLHYQPILTLADDTVRDAEGLLRWQLDGRLVPPDEFISIAEESGLVVPLGRWALQRACRDLATLDGVRLSVNASARQLHDATFVAAVENAIATAGVDPARLTVELTESAVVDDPDAAEMVLSRLKALGVQIALDDFGTGYSSLSYLLRLPVDSLKIDRSFVGDVTTRPRTQLLLHGITALAHDLGISVTVEGVETADQLEAIRATGCDKVQGYWIGRPVALAELTPAGAVSVG